MRKTFAIAYSAIVIAAALPLLAISWFVLLALRDPRRRWRYAHVATRCFFRSVGIRCGNERSVAPLNPPVVFVANHGSFLDAVILTAYFSLPVTFVAAEEFRSKFILGRILRRLGVEFVHRNTPNKAASEVRHLVDCVVAGKSLVIFAEGSLGDRPGIREFEIGAFYAAARAHVDVVPVGISGADYVLAPHTKLVRPGSVSVLEGPRVAPVGTRRRELEAVARATRNIVLELSGAPDIAIEMPQF